MVIRNKNFVEFFRTLRRPTTNYFLACLMLIHIEQMRLDAMVQLVRGHVFTLPEKLVRDKLNLPTLHDSQTLFTACGFYKEDGGQR